MLTRLCRPGGGPCAFSAPGERCCNNRRLLCASRCGGFDYSVQSWLCLLWSSVDTPSPVSSCLGQTQRQCVKDTCSRGGDSPIRRVTPKDSTVVSKTAVTSLERKLISLPARLEDTRERTYNHGDCSAELHDGSPPRFPPFRDQRPDRAARFSNCEAANGRARYEQHYFRAVGSSVIRWAGHLCRELNSPPPSIAKIAPALSSHEEWDHAVSIIGGFLRSRVSEPRSSAEPASPPRLRAFENRELTDTMRPSYLAFAAKDLSVPVPLHIAVSAGDKSKSEKQFSWLGGQAWNLLASYKQKEAITLEISDYMPRQAGINQKMRRILVNWMHMIPGDVVLESGRCLFLAVQILDRYLDNMDEPLTRQMLQLAGINALMIASKYENDTCAISPEYAAHLCDNAYSQMEVKAMELEMLSTLKFSLNEPVVPDFLEFYVAANNAMGTTDNYTRARFKLLCNYAAEAATLDYTLIRTSVPSKIAAACVLLAQQTLGFGTWNATLQSLSGYAEEDLMGCVSDLRDCILSMSADLEPILKERYSERKFLSVALLFGDDDSDGDSSCNSSS